MKKLPKKSKSPISEIFNEEVLREWKAGGDVDLEIDSMPDPRVVAGELAQAKAKVGMLRKLLKLSLAHHKLIYEQKTSNHDSNSASTSRQ